MHGTIKQASSIELSDKHAPVHSLTRAFTWMLIKVLIETLDP